LNNKLIIINTGGTFNKTYNRKTGLLEIKENNLYINEILNGLFRTNTKPKVKGLIYKDSLDIDENDRFKLLKTIQKSKKQNIIVIHGTDTMNKTALFLDKRIKDKNIILVGSMVPFSINKIEASSNLSMAIGYMNNIKKNNIYICMNGVIKKHNKIKKNYEKTVFEEI
jgi:L-asparaginase